MTDFKKKFYDITSLIQTEFDRNLDMYGDKIQCRRGCSKCCSQIFRITPLDGWMISEHIRQLPKAERARLQQKAREYINRLPLAKGECPDDNRGEGVIADETKASDHPGSSSHPSLKKEGNYDSLPCPALGTEGECTIYEARPVICRRFGMPIYDYKNPQNVHACELNFKDGDEITDDKLIPNQTEIGIKWDVLKDEFAQVEYIIPPFTKGGQGDSKDNAEVEWTTIAEAIVRA